MQFYLGPMSANVIWAAMTFHATHPQNPPLTFIPSRRQVDFQGGYVGNANGQPLTMQRLRELVGPHVAIERDHAGPQQGQQPDDGWESLLEDAKHADIIHIDPWKALPTYEDGLEWTVAAIKRCLQVNPALAFEVGTKEAIRPFTPQELDQLLSDLENQLTPAEFAAIRFAVVQCGTALKEGHNTGTFDDARLKQMLKVTNRYKKLAKEHNGDWISSATVAAKAALGLRHINIAPELGAIESRTLYALFQQPDREAFFDLCWKSRKWEKWVTADYDPQANKAHLVEICGHYVFADPAFRAIKAKYPTADLNAQHAIHERLNALYSIQVE